MNEVLGMHDTIARMPKVPDTNRFCCTTHFYSGLRPVTIVSGGRVNWIYQLIDLGLRRARAHGSASRLGPGSLERYLNLVAVMKAIDALHRVPSECG